MKSDSASTVTDMKPTRGYTMTTRAEAVEATRVAILDALVDLSQRRVFRDIGLEDVASGAGVSVQTVLRHFGSRSGVFEAASAHAQQSVVDERRVAEPGDVDEALTLLTAHYELRGDAVLLLLAQERTEDLAARIVADGRALHRRWVEESFAPLLPGPGGPRDEAVDLLVVATDVYTWKLLRRDRGLGRTRVQQRMVHLVRAVLTSLGTGMEEDER
jgi:AcrR family transcriptional regulator